MTTPTNNQLQAIVEAGKLATRRPWHWATSNSMRRLGSPCRDGDVAFGQVNRHDNVAGIAISERDMAYSELACNHADHLAAELMEMRGKVERYAAACERRADSSTDHGVSLAFGTVARELKQLLDG